MDTRLYAIAYDVSCPKRWRRIHRTLRRRGAWHQLSIFLCRLSPAGFAGLERDLVRLLDARNDRLLIVDLGPGARAEANLRRYGASEPLPHASVRIL